MIRTARDELVVVYQDTVCHEAEAQIMVANRARPSQHYGLGEASLSGTVRIRNQREAVALTRVPSDPHDDPDFTLTAWPRQDHLELAPFPGAVPCARLHTRQVLWEWGLSRLADTAELLVSELTTNAVQASHAVGRNPIRLWLLANDTQALILVWDASPRAPEPADADPDAESGRGLLLIDAISDSWAWYPTPEIGGKVVWAKIGHALSAHLGAS